jgi:hypothetical protein
MGAKSRGYYQDATVSASTSLADIVGAAVPSNADFCTVQAQDQPCRWRSDGNAPTASVGNLLAAGDTITLRRGMFSNFRIIETAASAKVNVEFFKTG